MTKRADIEVKTLLGTNSCTLLKTAKKWCAQCWSRAENHVSYKRSHFAENGLKVVRPVRKWQNVLISGWNRCFVQTRALCKKSLKLVRPVQNWQNVLLWVWKLWLFSHLGCKTLFCTNSFTLAKKCFAQCGNDKTACSRSEFAVLSKLVQFAKNG